jgi:N-acetylglutamate synthase-like GNAT family acetyltransferase
MTVRELPEAEWDKLIGTELETVRPWFPPFTRVLVIEEGDRVVGCWSLFAIWHVEGVWIAPDARQRGSVARRLLSTMRQWIREVGARAVVTASMDDAISDYLRRVGAKPIPGTPFLWPMEP